MGNLSMDRVITNWILKKQGIAWILLVQDRVWCSHKHSNKPLDSIKDEELQL